MKTNIMTNRESEQRIGDALAKGALVWAPVYAVSVSTVIWGLTVNSGGAASFPGILMQSLLFFAPLCMLMEVIKWAITNRQPILKTMGRSKTHGFKHPLFMHSGSRLHNTHA